jgi:hypothetical protein
LHQLALEVETSVSIIARKMQELGTLKLKMFEISLEMAAKGNSVGEEGRGDPIEAKGSANSIVWPLLPPTAIHFYYKGECLCCSTLSGLCRLKPLLHAVLKETLLFPTISPPAFSMLASSMLTSAKSSTFLYTKSYRPLPSSPR